LKIDKTGAEKERKWRKTGKDLGTGEI